MVPPSRAGYQATITGNTLDAAATEQLLTETGYAKDAQGQWGKAGKPLKLRIAAPEKTEPYVGHDYLVQHSAGSGKSNTLAWLAHRLSSLHDAADAKVFDKVVVITDRRILDKQLQETIYQFEHAHGVVVRIDQNSQQLADALAGEQARIVITTLQKFPFVTEKIESLPNRTYAVIVDEAHSSQTGDSATALKAVLGSKAPGPETDEPPDPAEDALAEAVAARGRQPNLSFFAFTATPKARTLELFGRYDPATDRHVPFHLYSMRQAIEEGFILDVLANYVTYKTYWEIEQATPDDPSYDPGKAKAAIARFVSLHPHQLAQKAEVIVEHYRAKVAPQDRRAGQGDGRHRLPRARGPLQAGARQVHQRQGLPRRRRPRRLLRQARRSTASDVTESSMNGFPDTQTADQFDTDQWHLLVVAEKYQTGFDQPKLYAMYVDKPLTGLAAVQTLSRLNRTYDREASARTARSSSTSATRPRTSATSFEPWYGATVAPPTDPNLLYDTRHDLDPFGVLWPDEIERAVSLLLAKGKVAHDRVHAALAPAIDRFADLAIDEQDRFLDALKRFIRTYAFLSQVVTFTDTKLERDYLFCKALAAFLHTGGSEAVHPEVELTHLKIEQTFEGSVTLSETEGLIITIFGGGKLHEPEAEPLSQIIQRLNERFGTDVRPRGPGLLRRHRREAHAAGRHPAGGGGQLAGELRAPPGQGVPVRRARPTRRRRGHGPLLHRQPRHAGRDPHGLPAVRPRQGKGPPPGALRHRRPPRPRQGVDPPGVQGEPPHPRGHAARRSSPWRRRRSRRSPPS